MRNVSSIGCILFIMAALQISCQPTETTERDAKTEPVKVETKSAEEVKIERAKQSHLNFRVKLLGEKYRKAISQYALEGKFGTPEQKQMNAEMADDTKDFAAFQKAQLDRLAPPKAFQVTGPEAPGGPGDDPGRPTRPDPGPCVPGGECCQSTNSALRGSPYDFMPTDDNMQKTCPQIQINCCAKATKDGNCYGQPTYSYKTIKIPHGENPEEKGVEVCKLPVPAGDINLSNDSCNRDEGGMEKVTGKVRVSNEAAMGGSYKMGFTYGGSFESEVDARVPCIGGVKGTAKFHGSQDHSWDVRWGNAERTMIEVSETVYVDTCSGIEKNVQVMKAKEKTTFVWDLHEICALVKVKATGPSEIVATFGTTRIVPDGGGSTWAEVAAYSKRDKPCVKTGCRAPKDDEDCETCPCRSGELHGNRKGTLSGECYPHCFKGKSLAEGIARCNQSDSDEIESEYVDTCEDESCADHGSCSCSSKYK